MKDPVKQLDVKLHNFVNMQVGFNGAVRSDISGLRRVLMEREM